MDVDDTLLESDLSLREECIETVSQVQALGVRVAIATGRMYCSVRPIAERLGLTGYLITYNGGLVRSVAGETLWHKPVPPADAQSLIAIARREDFCLNFYVDDQLIVEDATDERVRYYTRIAGVEAVEADLEEAVAVAGSTKCLFVGEAARVPALLAMLSSRFPGLQFANSKPRFVEVTQGGVDKGVALAGLAAHYGVAIENVMAIGDSGNDIPMLAAAGWSVAVGNASAAAKQAAKAVVTAERGAGVCEALRRYVLEA